LLNYIILFALLAGIILLVKWFIDGNTDLVTDKVIVSSEKLPNDFDGFKIAQVSDLHDAEFGENNKELISALKQIAPDIIVITGDIIDSRRVNVERALSFSEQAVLIAPVYYVNGNNEFKVPKAYEKLKAGLEKNGVTVLENTSLNIKKGEAEITLVGISDPKFGLEYVNGVVKKPVNLHLDAVPHTENYKILLAHRPEYIKRYAKVTDLVLSGHAHGGQFILPFVGGVLAPGQGFFPKYYDGLYKCGETFMVVSRGLGNSSFPFRINNKPVVVEVELKALRG